MDTPHGETVRASMLDAGLALAVTALELSDVLLFHANQKHDLLRLGLVLVTALPLLAWRRWPFATLMLTASATVTLAALHAAHLGLGPIAGAYAVACWSGTLARRIAATIALIGVWLVPLLTSDASSIPANAAYYAAAWILGTLMRERRVTTAALQQRAVELASEREEKAALAAEMERARIARELHDVLTHSVSVMVIQAQAAQASSGDPQQVSRLLGRIESVGQESLAELRVLLARLRADEEPSARAPQPGLNRLDDLFAEVRAAGIDVSLAREGAEYAVPASVELSAYRIVQEALTNTMRHATSASARVVLRYLPGELALEILDDGPAVHARRPGEGRGLAGMRERASLVGGSLVTEDRPGGGFRVAARLPLHTDS